MSVQRRQKKVKNTFWRVQKTSSNWSGKICYKIFAQLGTSVARLGDFSKFLATNFLS